MAHTGSLFGNINMFKIAFIASLAMLLVACGGGSSGVAAPSALSYTSPLEATMGTAITPLSPTVTRQKKTRDGQPR